MKLRISDHEQRSFQQAADLAGLSMSAWVRMVLRERVPAAFAPGAPKPPFEDKGIKPP